MTFQAKALALAACVVALFTLCGFRPESSVQMNFDVIVTAASSYDPLAALRGQERFPGGAQLLRFHDDKSQPLVVGFFETADASVSFDATHILFAGKKAADEPWQIWELTLAGGSLRQVTAGERDAIRPLYLPAGRFVYAQRSSSGFQLVSAALDGTDRSPATVLSYAGANAIPADVLADGRVLFESGFPLGAGTSPELFLVYADGSGVESYRCDHGAGRWGGKQLASGDVVFTHGASLGRFTSPLAHEERVAAPVAKYAGAIAETSEGVWLVSAKRGTEKNYGLALWKPGSSTMQTVLSRPGIDLADPVLVAPRPTPKRHPSALHPWDYANLLALDVRISRDGALKGVPVSVRAETREADGRLIPLGTSPIEADGSYFVKIPGDKPIRFAVLDAKGAVLRQERGWFWARGGEQRICVGCHAGPERAAENRVPGVLLRSTQPTDLTGAPAATQHSSGGR